MVRPAVCWVLLLACAAEARAQDGGCPAHGGHGSVAAGIATVGMSEHITTSLNPEPGEGSFETTGGPGLTANADVALSSTWGLRVDGSWAASNVTLQYFDRHPAAPRASSDFGRVSMGDVQVGAVHWVPSSTRRVCLHTAILLGSYRYSYRGVESRVPGGAVLIGVGGATGVTRPYVEFRLALGADRGRPPLLAYDAVQVSLIGGIRRRW
jgi:hypothetical protein